MRALGDRAGAAGDVELAGPVHAVVGLDRDERHHEEDEEDAGDRQAVVQRLAALALGQTVVISSLPGVFIPRVSAALLGKCLKKAQFSHHTDK